MIRISNNPPKDGPDLPAFIRRNKKDYVLTILKRQYDDWWVVKYERADGSGRIFDFVESPSFVVATLEMEARIKNQLENHLTEESK